MITILSNPPSVSDHVVMVQANGTITEPDISRVIEAIQAILENHSSIGFYLELESVESMTFPALKKDLEYGLSLLSQRERIGRCAIITHQDWIKHMAELESKVFGLEIRCFHPLHQEAAKLWVQDIPIDADEVTSPQEGSSVQKLQQPAIRLLKTNKPNVIAFELDGHMTGAGLESMVQAITPILDNHDEVHGLARYKHFEGVDLISVMRTPGLAAAKLKAIDKMKRYAIVGAPEWAHAIVNTMAKALPIEIRHFNMDQEEEAWQWIGAQPAMGDVSS